MTSPNVPRNAYTNAPEQHPNLIIGSLQLFWWMIIHPSAWRNHLQLVQAAVMPDVSLVILIRKKRWRNLKFGRLLLQGYLILPLLANLLLGLVMWGLGVSAETMAWGVAWSMAWGVARNVTFGGMAFGMAWGMAWGLTFGVVFGMAWGLAWGEVSRVAWGLAWGLGLGVGLGVASPVPWGVGLGVASRIAWGMAWGSAWGVGFGVASGVASGLASHVGLGVAFGLGITINLWLPVLLYPFLTGWNILLYQLDKRRTANKPNFLRWHSAFWDEWQRLPLQGLDQHVLLVIERNSEEGKAALNYLSTSRQRWAAQAVQIELDARELENCRDITQISNAHRSLSVDELNSPVTILLTGFSRISEDVDAALHQTSTYNQRLVLSKLAKELDGLIQGLTRSDEKYAVRFLPIATNWYRIVTNHVIELAETVELSQEVDNPYIIGIPLTKQQEIFTGRAHIGTRIEQLLLDRRRPPLLLYGQRRMGKTSLLNNLGRLLPSTIIPMFVDLQGPVASAKDYAGFLYNIAKSMANSAKRQSALILPSLKRETLQDDPFTSFDEWLDKVEQALQQNIALLALDEFEALDNAITKGRFDEEDVLGMLRHLIQHRPRFKVLLAGSHTIEEFQRWASYLINIQVVHISYLKQPEARQLIEQPVQDFTLRYEPNAVKRVLQLTRCHPFLIQLLCGEIITLKNEQDPSIRRLATLVDVEAAVAAALSTGSFFFADIQNNQVDATGRAILRFLAAKGEGKIVSKKTILQHFTDEYDAINLLLQRELIEEFGDGYRFQVELIRRWFASSVK